MEKIISYNDLPSGKGKSVYFRMEADPKLYLNLLTKGYKVLNDIQDANDDTIYITGKRQDKYFRTLEEYVQFINFKMQQELAEHNIVKPEEVSFNYYDLVDHKYSIPFVLKNEYQNGGREKFLINTEEDYEKLIRACELLINRNLMSMIPVEDDIRSEIDYNKYLNVCFKVQEYIQTPSEYNTTVRLLTSSSQDLLYASLKYNKPDKYSDDTTLLGYLLSEVFPLSTKTIVSNTLSGGENILLGESNYSSFESKLLKEHNISNEKFEDLIHSSMAVHDSNKEALGIICGFDYIYDRERDKWYLLEYHSRPMVGDYSKRQGIDYDTKEDRITAEGRVRATALSLTLKK